jgi:hypothetical protein
MVDTTSQCNHNEFTEMFCLNCGIIIIEDKVDYSFR